MLYVGIDIAKDKHDFFILGENKEKLIGPITIPNTLEGFNILVKAIYGITVCSKDVRIGLESTGHYGCNLIHFLLQQGFTLYLLNPKHTSDMHKASTLRKTKTDKVDAKMLASIVYAESDTLTPYTATSYHIEELKSLTRYRTRLVQDCTRLKISLKRLVNILFPEYDSVFSNLHSECSYTLLSEFPSKEFLTKANIVRLTNIISRTTRGRYKRATAEQIRNLAKGSIGMISEVRSMELQDTIERIRHLTAKIRQLDQIISERMQEVDTKITTIPGIGNTLAAIIVSEIGDIRRFSHPDKLVAFAGLSPSIYQSGHFLGTHAKMEKRGSRQLRCAIMLSAEHAARYNPYFASQLHKKRCEGKAYRVAVSHVARNLLRLIYRMEITKEAYHAAKS